jgi:ferredoxin
MPIWRPADDEWYRAEPPSDSMRPHEQCCVAGFAVLLAYKCFHSYRGFRAAGSLDGFAVCMGCLVCLSACGKAGEVGLLGERNKQIIARNRAASQNRERLEELRARFTQQRYSQFFEAVRGDDAETVRVMLDEVRASFRLPVRLSNRVSLCGPTLYVCPWALNIVRSCRAPTRTSR